jgi:hypothetical protein
VRRVRRMWRLAVPAIAAVALLACTGGAFARPQLLVTGPTATAASGTTVLEVKGAAVDAAWAQLTTYVPSGYTINLGQPVGTRIGSVSARAQLLASGATAGATGVVLVADRNDAAVQQAATQCTRSATHAGAWLMRLTLPAQTLDVPVYVDPTTGSEAGFGSAKLVLCLPQPYAKGLPAYAPLGTKIDDLRTTLSAGVFTNPLSAGSHVWRTVVVPWNSSGATQDAAASVETQGLVGVPSSLSLKAKLTTTRGRLTVRNSVLLSGTLLEDLRGVPGVTVSFFATDRNAGTARTSAAGSFARKILLVQRKTFRVTATVPTRDAPCVSPLPSSVAPAGCVSATRAAYRLRSGSIVVMPRTH